MTKYSINCLHFDSDLAECHCQLTASLNSDLESKKFRTIKS